MKFRPCIDLHNGQVKQIVGSTLKKKNDDDDDVTTNFATEVPAADFARRYQNDSLTGGHVILLGPGNQEAAVSALAAYPGGLQVGGGIKDTATARRWLDAGASHIIITSFAFDAAAADGGQQELRLDRLDALRSAVTKEKIVLDLSCRKRGGVYYVVTDRWQTFTSTQVTPATLQQLAEYCDEFLVHGVDVEGKQCGILDDLVELLGQHSPLPVTYAGGVRSLADLDLVEKLGNGRVDCTVGSALDIFGGSLKYSEVVSWHNERNKDSTS